MKRDIKIETPYGEISRMEIKEVVKQGSTYAAIGRTKDIRKGIRNYRKMEIEKKIEYGLTKQT